MKDLLGGTSFYSHHWCVLGNISVALKGHVQNNIVTPYDIPGSLWINLVTHILGQTTVLLIQHKYSPCFVLNQKMTMPQSYFQKKVYGMLNKQVCLE